MLRRQTTGSVVCPTCGRLVGVRDERCFICGRPNPGLWGWAPALKGLGRDFGTTQVVLGASVLFYVLTLVAAPRGIGMGGLFSLLSPDGRTLLVFGASGAAPVFGYGRWWTLLSAAWLHGSLLHIVFNMMWLRQLLPATVHGFGPGRALVLYVASSITGFALSSAAGLGLTMTSGLIPRALETVMGMPMITLGASAPLFGLMGALVLYSQRTGHTALGRQVWGWAIAVFAIAIVMNVGQGSIGIDNWAHLGGFVGGYLGARLLDPLKAEGAEMVLAGLVCLLLSLASVVVSVVHGLRVFS